MENKKRAIVTVITALIFVISALMFIILLTNQSIGQSMHGNAVLNPTMVFGDTENVAKINMTVKNSNYYPDKIYVKKNQPVEITLDKNARGCFRYFTIGGLGISIYSESPQDKIIFTPTKRGTFTFNCDKGLGDGKLIVS